MKLAFGTKLSYEIGGVADNAMSTISETYLLFFLTTVAGIHPAAAGTIAAIGPVWEAICGPIFGYFSDSIETRFGKRKTFLLCNHDGAVLDGVFIFLCAVYGMGGGDFRRSMQLYCIACRCIDHQKNDSKNFKKNPDKPKIFFIHNIVEMFKGYIKIHSLRPIRFLIGASILYLVANTIFSSDRVYYFTYNMGCQLVRYCGPCLLLPS